MERNIWNTQPARKIPLKQVFLNFLIIWNWNISVFCINWNISVFCINWNISVLCINWNISVLCINWNISVLCILWISELLSMQGLTYIVKVLTVRSFLVTTYYFKIIFSGAFHDIFARKNRKNRKKFGQRESGLSELLHLLPRYLLKYIFRFLLIRLTSYIY